MAQSVQSRERESTEGAGQNQLRPCLEISGDGVNSLVNRPPTMESRLHDVPIPHFTTGLESGDRPPFGLDLSRP